MRSALTRAYARRNLAHGIYPPQNMADRIGALGGSLRVDSAPGRGTRVAGRVPVEA